MKQIKWSAIVAREKFAQWLHWMKWHGFSSTQLYPKMTHTERRRTKHRYKERRIRRKRNNNSKKSVLLFDFPSRRSSVILDSVLRDWVCILVLAIEMSQKISKNTIKKKKKRREEQRKKKKSKSRKTAVNSSYIYVISHIELTVRFHFDSAHLTFSLQHDELHDRIVLNCK